MSSSPDPWADHEDDPDEFEDWDAYERARGRREGPSPSGVIVPRPDPHRLFAPRWHRLYGDDLPEGMDVELPGPMTAHVDPRYL